MAANHYLLRHIWSRKWLYAGGLLSLLVTSLTEVLAPKFAQWTLDALIKPEVGVDVVREKLANLAGFFMLLCAVAMVGRAGWRHTLARSTHEAGRMLRLQFWDKASSLPLRFFREGSLGELMSRFSTDINQARMVFGFTLVLWLDCVFFSVFAFASMLWISWRAGLGCMFVLATVPFFIRRLARLEYAQHERAQGALAVFSDRMAQNLSAVRTQKASGVAEAWSEMLRAGARTYAHDRVRVLKTGLRIFPVTSSASLVCVMVVMVTSWFDLHAGRISAGGVFALFAYATLLQTPLFELADLVSEWQRGRASLDRVLNFQRTPPAGEFVGSNRANSPSSIPRDHLQRILPSSEQDFKLEIQSLEIRAASRGRHEDFTIGPLDLFARTGEWIGISGRIGVGKSLLLATIAGIHDDATGKIGVESVTYLPQRPFIFSGTIRENLELGSPGSDADLWFALDLVELSSEIRSMQGGLDTPLHEGGVNLSGGQRQRLTIARALLRKAPVMLLDSPLSALDEATEEKVLRNLRLALGDVTVIIVSHRPSVLAACDRVVDLQNESGQVILKESTCVASPDRSAFRKHAFEVMLDA